MFDIIGVMALVALGLVFFWLAKSAARIRSSFIRWILLAPSILFASIFVVLTVTSLIGFQRIDFPKRSAAASIHVVATPERLARGQRIAAICTECHATGAGAPLIGRNFFAEGGPPIGTLYAPNLTRAGEINDWSDGEVIRAIREGIHKDGRALIVMPSKAFHNLSDDDVQSMVAYLRSLAPAGTRSPPSKFNVLGSEFIGLDAAPTSAQPAITRPVVAPAAGQSAEYGRYLVSIANCADCHGDDLAGRHPKLPGPPGAPNLTAIIPAYGTGEDFIKLIRTGVTPGGRSLTGPMPWKYFSAFATDDDLLAIYSYLHSLKAIEK